MKIFNKKFKVKVVHFNEDYYIIKYAYYRFIPIYHTLNYWFELTLTSNLEEWTCMIFKVDKAEEVARKMKSIEDVKEWYEPYKNEEKDFYKRKKDFYNNNVPYKVKHF